MEKKTASGILLTLLLTSMLTLAFNIQPVETESSPLAVPEGSSVIQENTNLASQEPPPTEWNKTYGGTDDDRAYALVQTGDGGYALAGEGVSFGTGGYDFWLVKTAPWTPTPVLIPGKDVPAEAPDFFTSVLTKLNIPTSEFAVQALTIWTNYENTNAYWNPLATTWDMGEKSWNFNEAGVKNYADKETGIQATANTLALHYYESIREMLAIQSFNEQHLREAVATWSGLNPGDSYVINLVNEWRNIYPLSADQPPTCVIKLQKDGVEIHEVERAEFFDIYVGDSTDDTGIKQVHFSSDDVRDNMPTGEWTKWYNWSVSSGDWNASTRIKRWAFATPGYKEVWAEVIDDAGQTAICSATIFVPAPALPVITSPLVITPVKDMYRVGDSLEAEFTIKNIGENPITLDVLTVGGRLNGMIPPEGAPDFTFQSVILHSSESYHYGGSLTLTQKGNYHFFIAYHIENPTLEEKELLDENNWNTCIELGEGLTHIDRVRNIIVFEEGTVPEEINALREQIGRLKKQHVSYPPYLLEADSWDSAVSTLWADFTSFATRTDLREKYDELYQTGFNYQWFRIRALIDAGNSLDRGDMANAKKYLQRSYKYDKLSWMSFSAAAQVFDGNIAAGQVLADGIREGCETAVRFGIAVVCPAAALKVDAFYMGINWVFNTELEGWEQATIDLVIDIAFTTIFKIVQFKNLDYNTLENYVNTVSTNVPLDTLLGNKEFMAEFGIELKKVMIDRIAEGITEEVIEKVVEKTLRYYESMKDSLQIKTKSPVELRVVDSKGQITGLVNNKVKHEISMSLYYNETVTILFPADTYQIEVLGTDEGTYGLETTLMQNGQITTFDAIDIPVSINTTHQYTVDWDALSAGKEGVTVMVDSDGDGVFEHIFASDSELTQSEYVIATDNTPPTTTLIIGEPKYVAEITYVTPDAPFILEANDGEGSGVYLTSYRIRNSTYNTGWLIYTSPFNSTSLADGVYTIEFNSTDNAGNVEATNAIQFTLFSWNHIFEDTYGRETVLKINTKHKFFQFITPDKNYGIRKAKYMQTSSRAIVISHYDSELRLLSIAVDTKLDFCIVNAWDLQTRKQYILIDKPGIEK
jgi:hypothetical protein